MRYTLSPDAACAVVEDGAVILHMRTKRYYSLNETGQAIWTMLEAGLALPQIVEHLTAAWEVDADAAARAVRQMLADLAAVELVRLEEA